MTRLVARLILAMLTLPISAALFLFMALALIQGGPPAPQTIIVMWVAEYVVIAGYWLLLWRNVVRWTRQRIIGTLLVTLGAFVCGAIGAVFVYEFVEAEIALALLIGGGVVPIVWVLGTVLVWWESSQERLERLKSYGTDTVCCINCGYNMTGLRDARCPECGSQFTLDELLTAQHEREQELEQS